MTRPETALKHEKIAAVLEGEIRSGQIGRDGQLPGEIELAKRFGVSRSTVRNALAELSEAGLIATRVGKGSFILFDDRPLDARHGWARAFDAHGVQATVDVVSVRRRSSPSLAEDLGCPAPDFVVVERVRKLQDKTGISLEWSWLPATGTLLDLVDADVREVSLTEVLAENQLFPDHGSQRIGGRRLQAEESAVLNRPVDSWFLFMRRTSWTADGALVEHIECLLDPKHFTFGLEVAGTSLFPQRAGDGA